MSVASKRVKKALAAIDELELDGEELRELQSALREREVCEIDYEACKTPEDRELAEMLKRRIDAAARGETRMVPIGEFIRGGREEVRTLSMTEANKIFVNEPKLGAELFDSPR